MAYSSVAGVAFGGVTKSGIDVIASGPTFGAANGVIVQEDAGLTAVSSTFPPDLKVPPNDRPSAVSINDSGEVVFALSKQAPFACIGLYYYEAATAPEPELLSWKTAVRYNLQIDNAGNVVAYFK